MALKNRNGIWHVRKMVGSVLIAKSTKTGNKRIAEQLEAKWISEVHKEVVVAGRKPLTVQKAIELFVKSRRGTVGQANAILRLQLWEDFYKTQLHSVNVEELQSHALDVVDAGTYSVSTINTSIVYWNAVQNYCGKHGYTVSGKLTRIKANTNKLRFLTIVEIDKLLEALGVNDLTKCASIKAQDNLDFVQMLLHTGARDREIATIKLDQFDLIGNTVTIHRSKGGTNTTLAMSDVVREIVTRRIAESSKPLPADAMLYNRAGGGYLFPERACRRSQAAWFKTACRRANLTDVSFHTLRHTFATRMLQAGLSIVEVQHLMGHRNIASTMVYAHITPNLTGNRAAAVLNGQSAVAASAASRPQLQLHQGGLQNAA